MLVLAVALMGAFLGLERRRSQRGRPVVLDPALTRLSPLVEHLAARDGARTAVLAGLGLEAAGLVGVAVAVQSPHVLWIVPAFLVYGLGIGGAAAQLSNLVLAEVPEGLVGLVAVRRMRTGADPEWIVPEPEPARA